MVIISLCSSVAAGSLYHIPMCWIAAADDLLLLLLV
jgi:hypothetical protein